METLDALQQTFAGWRERNFPTTYHRPELQALGVGEESGELQRAVLKREQGIRNITDSQIKKEIADVVIFAMSVADCYGWLLSDILQEVSPSVLERDWIAYPASGRPDDQGATDAAKH